MSVSALFVIVLAFTPSQDNGLGTCFQCHFFFFDCPAPVSYWGKQCRLDLRARHFSANCVHEVTGKEMHCSFLGCHFHGLRKLQSSSRGRNTVLCSHHTGHADSCGELRSLSPSLDALEWQVFPDDVSARPDKNSL